MPKAIKVDDSLRDKQQACIYSKNKIVCLDDFDKDHPQKRRICICVLENKYKKYYKTYARFY